MAAREIGADAAIAAGLAHQGNLASESALAVFGLAAAMKASGRLTLTGKGQTYVLSFRRGTVEHASSTDPQDDLGRFLLERDVIPPAALAQAEATQGAVGGDLVTALIAGRFVNPGDVAALLQEHGSRVAQHALAVEAGGWSWDPQAAPPPGAFPLGSPFGMLCAAVRTLDAAALMRRLGEREHRVASRIGGRVALEELRLTAQEARAAAQFDGARSPAELAAANPGDTLAVLRLAVLLGELQLLAFGAPRKGAPPPAPAAAPAPAAPAAAPVTGAKPTAPVVPAAAKVPTPPAATRTAPAVTPRPATPPPSAPRPAATSASAPRPGTTPAPVPTPRPAALDRASLEKLQAKLRDADHFAVLGVKQDATGAQIKAAYFQLAKSYHPDAIPTDTGPDLKKLCADVFAKVSEAWSVLSDEGSRATYLERIRTGGTAEVDVARIFQAENVFQAGTLLVKGRRYDEALRKFDEAMKLNTDEPEFGMWKAWCEFLLADDKAKKFGPASIAIEAGLKKNPRCAQGYLFLGQMAKIAGNLALAEKSLRRGLDVAPDHMDLQRELKYLRK
jgi:curved DNA-binding protein CbpA